MPDPPATEQAPQTTSSRCSTGGNGTVMRVLVNGREARELAPNFSQWEAVLENAGQGLVWVSAHAEDAAGNAERVPQAVAVPAPAARP